jgi:hypothetical protein
VADTHELPVPDRLVFRVGYCTTVGFRVLEEVDGKLGGMDISAARYSVRLRAQEDGGDAYLFDVVLPKSGAPAGGSGWVRGFAPAMLAGWEGKNLRFRVVLIDTDSDPVNPTETDDFEEELGWFMRTVLPGLAAPAP